MLGLGFGAFGFQTSEPQGFFHARNTPNPAPTSSSELEFASAPRNEGLKPPA